MNIQIADIGSDRTDEAIEVFTEAFAGDPLFMFAFPEEGTRKKQTRIMYEFVVLDMVSLLNLRLLGAFSDSNALTGCMIYSTPERKEWGKHMDSAILKMREKSNNSRIGLIGEFAMMEGYDPGKPLFYGNELAIRSEYRRQGIGKALTNYLICECKRHPAAEGILIDSANTNNVKLYEKWGWELKQARDFYSIKKYFMWRNK